MELSFEKLAVLLLVAAVVAMLTRRLRLPYVVGLVAAGILMALLPFSPQMQLTKDLLFTALLPPLIFEAAFYLSWMNLKKELPVVLVLASLGVVFSAGITAAGMHFASHWPWSAALIFGALIAATDPVSVIAAFKEAKVAGRLRLLIESESLFNDGTAAVLFAIVLEVALGHSWTPLEIASRLSIMVGGSLVCGTVIGGLALLLAGRTEDHLVEITLTTVTAYGSFLLAEQLHFSGVLATLVSGLMLGTIGTRSTFSARGREAVQAFWEYAAFVANSLIFLLIGMREASQNFLAEWPMIVAAICFVILGRIVAVYPCCAMFARSSLRVTAQHQHALCWGGLRGALALALALALPPEIPYRASIITVSFAVVTFSVFVQGLTLTPLLRHLGELSGMAQERRR